MIADVTLVLFDHGRYKTELIPAARAVIERDETRALVKLLRTVAASPFALRWAGATAAQLDDHIRTLEGTHASPHDLQLFMKWKCLPRLMGLYVPQMAEVTPVQELGQSQLMEYLFARSNWILECLAFAEDASGTALEYPFGDWGILLSVEEVKRFHHELDHVALPRNPRIAADLRDLQALIRHAASTKTPSLMVMGR